MGLVEGEIDDPAWSRIGIDHDRLSLVVGRYHPRASRKRRVSAKSARVGPTPSIKIATIHGAIFVARVLLFRRRIVGEIGKAIGWSL